MTGLDEAQVAAMGGGERQALRAALLAAFPARARLEELLDRIDRQVELYAAESVPLRDVVLAVVKVALAEGWLARLMAEAAAMNPGNGQLAAVVDRYRGTSGPPRGSAATSQVEAAANVGVGVPPQARPAGPPPSDRELIGTLADEFPDPASAGPVVERAGLRRGLQPGWQARTAEAYWWEVHRMMVNGAVVGGWPNVLREAMAERPGNAVIAAAAAAAGVTA
ncbi:effector-associated domain EAD1-containing protein [Pseudofrankia saprophytica]|uniref:effector-associated domain EAD1-containing protein n=1 Tax=Pseudofrankia saprophytica TaxID=298655 RepID=UPI000234D65B|nr:effector-associated domain EAD1-containing protein [Pseudofrankia saprophytica]